jgi:hypothetical protein
MSCRRHLLAALGAVCLTSGTGAALAVQSAPTPTQITVTPVASLGPGERAPVDAAGVKAIRRGKTIPAGYELVGQRVEIERGTKAAGAYLRFQCPGSKRLRSFLITGSAGFVAPRAYVNHRSTFVGSFPSFSDGATTRSGVVYAVCR